MATTLSRSDYVRALPNLSQTAELIDIDPAGITRAIQRLGIEPLVWGGREKHLSIRDLLRIATHAQRASLEEVAGGLLGWTESEHPELSETFRREVDEFFASLPTPTADDPERFVAELYEALPKPWAERAEAIWRKHTSADQVSRVK